MTDKIIIIQCSSSKRNDNTTFGLKNKIRFVANPQTPLSYKPDDLVPNTDITWRQVVVRYNENPILRDVQLLQAGCLYKPSIYKETINIFGKYNVYILSAGWGLVQSSYFIPSYDITFSGTAPKEFRRKPNDEYKDFNHLILRNDLDKHEIHFFGGISYLNVLYKLLEPITNSKKIIHSATDIEPKLGYEYIKYPRCFTNWHYSALKEFNKQIVL